MKTRARGTWAWLAVVTLGGATARVFAQATPGADARPVAGVEELACAPALAWAEPQQPIRLVGSEEGVVQRMYGPRDALVLDAGLDRRLQVGDLFFVRRLIRPMPMRSAGGRTPWLRHTAGWIRIVATEQRSAVATVEHACDGLLQGDFLEPFERPEVPPVRAPGEPDYQNAAQVLFGQDGSSSIGTGQFMVINRGDDHGVQAGQRVRLFRVSFGADGPVTDLGDGVVVAVASESATVRVLQLRDAVYAGDPAALQR